MARLIVVSVALVIIFSLAGSSPQLVAAQSVAPPAEAPASYASDLALAERYVPVLYLHPDETYLPQSVDVVMSLSRLRQSKRLWFDTNLLNSFTTHDLLTISSDPSSFLDQWFGDTGSSEYANYASHRAVYTASISPLVGGPPALAYAHVVHSANPEYTAIQYWLFYFYNDWFNKHEGDWELVEVILSAAEQPAWAIYSQHHGGVRRTWDTTPLEDATHPVVYVARGSHANYFSGDEVFAFDQNIGNRQLVLVDRTGSAVRLQPKVTLIPTRPELAANPEGWPGAEWLMFRGRWGETGVYGDFNGPYGPADKGLQWDDPYSWGIDQPLDQETWYKNRLRLEISAPAQSSVVIRLLDAADRPLSHSEVLKNLALLHADPPQSVLAAVQGAPSASLSLTVYWPDRLSRSVTRTSYSGLVLDEAGNARLEISVAGVRSLNASGPLALSGRILDSYVAIWDAPDSVLVGNTLPLQEILAGLLLALLISLLPVLILVAILYWVDRYHKGPLRLLVIAFAWGALPALLVAFSVQLFLKIPPNLMGSSVLEGIRLGFLAPVVEELLKALGVLFIFWRYRGEIDDVLGGMLYGAMVGFGFAFVSNLFRYAGDFISLGFPALNLSFVLVRTVHVLNHGLYTAIFGTFLGVAAKETRRLRFWAWTLAGLVLAVATHSLQNLLSNSLVGLNVFTVIVTFSGTLVLWGVAGWSLVQQSRMLRTELQGVVHASLYTSVQDPFTRLGAQWRTLRREGFRTWLQFRRLQGLCIQLANARLQSRLHPEKQAWAGEALQLQAKIEQIFERLNPVGR